MVQALASRAKSVSWIDANRIQCECPICASENGGTDEVRNLFARRTGEQVSLVCFAGHTDVAILQALELTRTDLSSPPHKNGTVAPPQSPAEPFSTNGATTTLPATYAEWKYQSGMVIKRALYDSVPEKDRPTIASMQADKLVDLLIKQAHEVIDIRVAPWWPLPAELSETDIDEELQEMAGRAVTLFRNAYLPATSNGHPAVVDLPVETFDAAIIANQRYLERQPVIEGLCFSSACSMITGGKHSGKSTLARWEAICVAKGYEFLGRTVQQGPVIYLASEDEEMVARSELMRLGWIATDPLYFVGKTQIPDDLDEEAVLRLLADQVRKRSAVLCVVDMLFDFVPVRDELGYAETRRAVGLIQDVASSTGIHLTVLHHAPKHTSLSADAAVTALGSQGLAARVSPIILTRRYGPGVHAVVTTSVRDPRGKGIRDSRLTMLADGSLKLGGDFKAYMLAEVYADRVLELIEGEPGQEFTITDVMEKIEIEYEPTRATLKHLWTGGRIERTGQGKKGSPFRYFVPLTKITPANTPPPEDFSPHPPGPVGEMDKDSSIPEREAQRGSKYKQKSLTPPGDDDDDLDEYGISKSQ